MGFDRTQWFQAVARAYVKTTYRRPWLWLGLIALCVVAMGGVAGGLRIRTDPRLLLSDDAPSVRSLDLSERRLGSTDFFIIAFEDSSAEKVARFQKALADSVGHWKETQWVQFDEDRRFFQRHALMYLPRTQLEELEARLRSMASAARRANPLYLDLLGDSSSAPANLDGWPDPVALYKQGIPMDVVAGFLEQVQKSSASEPAPGGAGHDSSPTLPDSLHFRLIGYQAKGKWVGAVVAQLNTTSMETSFASLARSHGEREIASVRRDLGIEIRASVVGAYRDPFSELREVGSDIGASLGAALVLVFLLLSFYLRRPGSALTVFFPLVVAMAGTLCAVQAIYGRLTSLTAFVLVLMPGLGIRYSIHIFSRWTEERRRGRSVDEAMGISLVRTGRSLVTAMGASVICLLALQVGGLRGFREFGVVVSIGVVLTLLCSLAVLPPLLFSLVDMGARMGSTPLRFLGWLVPSGNRRDGAVLIPEFEWQTPKVLTMFGIAGVVSVVFLLAPKVEFESDFNNLGLGKSRWEWVAGRISRVWKIPLVGFEPSDSIGYERAIGFGLHSTPSVVLANSEAQMREIHDTLGARYGTRRDSMLRSFVTIQSFVPRPEDQRERLRVLDRIRSLLDSRAFEAADSVQKAKLARLKGFIVRDTFGFDSIPAYARHFLTESDGSHGKFGLIYGSLRASDAGESRRFQDRNGAFRTAGGVVPVASAGFVFADVVESVKHGFGWVAAAAFALLAAIVWFDTRSWRGMVVNLGYSALVALWTYGAMGWLGLRLGMFNVVVLPALLSGTLDTTIQLYHRRMEVGAGRIGEVYHTTGSSVLAGTLTNAFGFFGLVLVAHRGMNTIGSLACLGYAAGILVMFLVMPLVLEAVCPAMPLVSPWAGAWKADQVKS